MTNRLSSVTWFLFYSSDDNSVWEQQSVPDESERWNPNKSLPLDVAAVTHEIDQIKLPSAEAPFFRRVNGHRGFSGRIQALGFPFLYEDPFDFGGRERQSPGVVTQPCEAVARAAYRSHVLVVVVVLIVVGLDQTDPGPPPPFLTPDPTPGRDMSGSRDVEYSRSFH